MEARWRDTLRGEPAAHRIHHRRGAAEIDVHITAMQMGRLDMGSDIALARMRAGLRRYDGREGEARDAGREGLELAHAHQVGVVGHSIDEVDGLRRARHGDSAIPFHDATIERTLLRNETLCVALSLTHRLSSRTGLLKLSELAGDALVVYPKSPRPSFADQVLALFRERDLKPRALLEVRELQTALGLVAADSGVCIVPASVERLRRDNVVYRRLDEPGAVSPIIMSARKGDRSPEIGLILRLVKEMYKKEGITFGA